MPGINPRGESTRTTPGSSHCQRRKVKRVVQGGRAARIPTQRMRRKAPLGVQGDRAARFLRNASGANASRAYRGSSDASSSSSPVAQKVVVGEQGDRAERVRYRFQRRKSSVGVQVIETHHRSWTIARTTISLRKPKNAVPANEMSPGGNVCPDTPTLARGDAAATRTRAAISSPAMPGSHDVCRVIPGLFKSHGRRPRSKRRNSLVGVQERS
jgi:hypothetical protein